MQINEITGSIIDSCVKIHRCLGPGLFESVYEEVLFYELIKRGFYVERQVPIPVIYDQLKMEIGFRADVVVEKRVIVEIKSIEAVGNIHRKQVLTYL